jgi:hypothetical protein
MRGGLIQNKCFKCLITSAVQLIQVDVALFRLKLFAFAKAVAHVEADALGTVVLVNFI